MLPSCRNMFDLFYMMENISIKTIQPIWTTSECVHGQIKNKLFNFIRLCFLFGQAM